jgi:putative endonuclease
MADQKRIVYILRSNRDPARHYTGLTSDLRSRLRWHNESASGYGVRDRPWSVVVAIEFRTEATARRFERYLKSGSGRAFTKRHLAESSAEVEIGN